MFNASRPASVGRGKARVAQEKVEGHREDGEDQRLRGDVDPETGRPHRDRRQSQGQDRQKAGLPGSTEATSNHIRRPSSPEGRTTSTAAINAKIRPIAN